MARGEKGENGREKKNLHASVGRVAKEVKMKKEIRASRKEKSR